jgi:hypothetical protein
LRLWYAQSVALPVALLLIPVALLLAGGKGRRSGAAPPLGPWMDDVPPEPLAVGQRGDPEIEALLTEMNDEFRSYGVNLDWIDAAQVTEMRKTNGYYAIPPREYWPRMAATVYYGFQPIRRALGIPVRITSGYRPADYNEAVGGAPGSRHQFFEALDMLPDSNWNDQAMLAAQLFVRDGERLRMGLGVYGSPGAATNIHVDTGSAMRTWENGAWWVARAREVA